MYVFGAILIYTVRRDPSIVYTSNIFAILGLRVMYFLLPPRSPSTRIARANV
jgi:predicted tellurium resistance membrane protein TerC